MPVAIGSLIRHAAVAACLTLTADFPALAQQPLADPPATAAFMPRFDFHMSAAALGHADQRFSWDTHWAGDFDLVDYVFGRATFLTDYQALLGHEFRPFDPYQSNYLLEASGSARLGRTEVAAVLSHVSRHLGDRPKRLAIAENSLGGRVLRRFAQPGVTIDLRADLRKVIERAYVDYTWIGDADVTVRRAVNQRVQVYGRGYGETYAVDKTVAQRDAQHGGRVEGGVRLIGSGAVMELFAGYERVVDADPLDRQPRRWPFVGFRLVGGPPDR
jgi:hypothetical protein